VLTSTNRSKPRCQRVGPWSLNRLRDCRTDQQLDREQRRQDLRDQRSRRWMRIIFSTGLVAAVLTGRIPVREIIDAVLTAIQ
jgi:hypothetical protein